MIKNVNQEQDDNHSENVQDSQSDDEKEPLVNLDILLNNGKKAKLSIYEGDNIKEKVKHFCKNNRISPKEEEILLKRVNEELEANSNESQKEKKLLKNNLINKKVKETNNNQKREPKILDYIPNEKRKLDHILNESESFSISESVRKSKNNLENLIKDYKSDNVNKIYESEKESIVNQGIESQRSSKGNIEYNQNNKLN